MSLGTRLDRLETKIPPPAMSPEQRRAEIRRLMVKRGVDPTEIETEDGYQAVCKRELARIEAKRRGRPL